MPKQITDPVELKKIAEYNQKLGFGTIQNVDGVEKYVRGPKTTSTAPGEGVGTGFDIAKIDSPTQISGGSEPVTNAMNQVKYNGQGLLDEITANQNLFSKQMEAQQQNITNLINETKTLSDIDLKNIEQAGIAAGAKYDPLIAQAKESSRQGQAKSIVGAGQIGGFMNTQFAGQGALTPTEGGTFQGAGGELSKIKGQLENNIQALESAKLSAIAAAKAAAEQSIKTGKQTDIQNATKLYELAKNAFETQQAAVTQRLNVIGKLQEIQQSGVLFDQEQQKLAFDKLNTIGQVGGLVDVDLKKQLDAQYGQGFTDSYVEAAKKAKEATDTQSQIDAAKGIYDLLAKVPAGTKIQIGDASYEGLQTSDPNTQVFSEEDAAGNVTYVTIDKNTGQIISSASGGKIGKGRASSGGGGGGGADDKEIKAFQSDAADLILKLEKGDTTWGGAFDSLKVKYPQADNETINAALGGGIPYSPETGFDTTAAYGRAKTK